MYLKQTPETSQILGYGKYPHPTVGAGFAMAVLCKRLVVAVVRLTFPDKPPAE